MSDAIEPSWWARMTRAERRSRDQEPADLGTAFGMELWLGESAADGDHDDAQPRLEWLQRLKRRLDRN